jgi:hypothetical protein
MRRLARLPGWLESHRMGAKTRAILKLGFIAWFAFLCAAMEAFHTCVPNGPATSAKEECADCCTLHGFGKQASCNDATDSQIARDESKHLCTCNDGECLACLLGQASRAWNIEVAPLLLIAMQDSEGVGPLAECTGKAPCLSLTKARSPPLS